MDELQAVIDAAQQIGSDAASLAQSVSSTAESLGQQNQQLAAVCAPSKSGEEAAAKVANAQNALSACAAILSQLNEAVGDFIEDAMK